jgi:hypothetical protein
MEGLEPFIVRFRDLSLRLQLAHEHEPTLFDELNAAAGALLRICTGDAEVVYMMIKHNTLVSVSDVCRYMATSKSVLAQTASAEGDKASSVKKNVVVRLCRLVSNFTACGESARRHLFDINTQTNVAFEHLSHILAASIVVHDRNAVAAVVSAIYNCLQSSNVVLDEIQGAISARNDALCRSRPMLCQLLLAVLPKHNHTSHAQGDANHHESSIDMALEWFHMIAFHWIRSNWMQRIYRIVGPTNSSNTAAFTHEQVHVDNCIYLFPQAVKSYHFSCKQLIVLQLGINVMEDAYCTDILWGISADPMAFTSAKGRARCLLGSVLVTSRYCRMITLH